MYEIILITSLQKYTKGFGGGGGGKRDGETEY